MGHKIGDGKSADVAAPAATVINDGDLYRMATGAPSGFAIGKKDGVQTDLNMAVDIDKHAMYKIKLPAGLTPVVGARLWWSAGTGFKKGDTDLVAEGTANAIGPICKVIVAKNTAGYAQVQLCGGEPLGA